MHFCSFQVLAPPGYGRDFHTLPATSSDLSTAAVTIHIPKSPLTSAPASPRKVVADSKFSLPPNVTRKHREDMVYGQGGG